jgi:hypothetical protein
VLATRLRRLLHVRLPGLKRDLNRYLDDYNHDRPQGRLTTRGRIPADISTALPR